MDEAKLRRLEQSRDPVEISTLAAEAEGAIPSLQIDITDPPSPVIARVGEIEVVAPTADDAVNALGPELARSRRAALAADLRANTKAGG